MYLGKKIVIYLVVLFCVIAGLIVFFNFKKTSSSINPSPTATIESYSSVPVINFPDKELEERARGKERIEVNGEFKIIETDFTYNNLYLEVKGLIPDDIQELTAFKVNYANVYDRDIYGHTFSYVLDANKYPLSRFYQDQLDAAKLIGWTILATNLEESRFFIETTLDQNGFNLKMHSSVDRKGDRLEGNIHVLMTRL